MMPPDDRVLYPEFARRVKVACDNSDRIPAQNHGRYIYVRDELKRRFDIDVSKEAVRKWMVGENRPRAKKQEAFAEILGADKAWLFFGAENTVSQADTRKRVIGSNGAVHLVIGHMLMEGHNCAFPEPEDEDPCFHFFSIVEGRQLRIYAALGEELSGGAIRFSVPIDVDRPKVIGVVAGKGRDFEMYHITPSVASKHGKRKGGHIDLSLKKSGDRLTVAEAEIAPLKSFSEMVR